MKLGSTLLSTFFTLLIVLTVSSTPVLAATANGESCTSDLQCDSGFCSKQNHYAPGVCSERNCDVGSNGEITTGCFLYEVDPLKNTVNHIRFQTPGGFLTLLIPYLFTFAGLILFVMILWGGFEMLMGAADSKAQEAGKQRITAAVIGFMLLFVSYWIAQIIQYIFGVNFL